MDVSDKIVQCRTPAPVEADVGQVLEVARRSKLNAPVLGNIRSFEAGRPLTHPFGEFTAKRVCRTHVLPHQHQPSSRLKHAPKLPNGVSRIEPVDRLSAGDQRRRIVYKRQMLRHRTDGVDDWHGGGWDCLQHFHARVQGNDAPPDLGECSRKLTIPTAHVECDAPGGVTGSSRYAG